MRAPLLAALAVLLLPVGLAAQISPGPLSRAHRALEGTLKCTQCHGPQSDAMPRLCLDCHGEVAALQAQRRGLHARAGVMAGKRCASCHPEHAGREFDLIAWPGGERDRFDHRHAGWTLEGQHADLACDRCHRSEFRVDPVAKLSPRTGSAGWMGLETDCASCHAADDPHGEALGPACAECHDASGWLPARRFDHDSTSYPLTGAHRDVNCAACHTTPEPGSRPRADGTRLARFSPQPHQQCSACHADPHQGRLSARCSECHVTRGFDVLDRREFNHALTRYPLLGRHRTVGCEACHGRGMATPRPGFASCAACHEDRHGGEATLDGKPADCEACHRVTGFAPATFTVEQHAATRFPLGGKHREVACAKCHSSTAGAGGTATIHLRLAFDRCASCHQDPHGGQVGNRRCDACHSDAGWQASTFAAADHATTGLPLEGRHATIGCGACHGADRPGLPPLPASVTTGSAGILFHLPEVRCAACHRDPHASASGDPVRTTECTACHSSVAFRPATIGVTAHASFRFALEGAHRAVPCAECHTGIDRAAESLVPGATLLRATQRFTPVALAAVRDSTCAGCHASPHGDQFAGLVGGDRCERCHDSDAFAPAGRFDHDRDATFALKGAHATVACASCHPSETVGDTNRVRYRGIPTRCEACHGDARKGSPG